MKKQEILARLLDAGVIAVVRGKTEEEAIKVSDALVEGGVVGIELTFSTPNAVGVIEQLAKKYAGNKKVVVGAGTVLDPITARLAILAGAEYIVSPGFVAEISEICNLYAIPYLPGCVTIAEIQTAIKSGVDIVKLFPGSAVGPGYVKAVKAPLPHVNIMPTGGVSLNNLKEWFDAGVVAVGSGGNLTKVVDGDYSSCTKAAKEWIAALNEVRK
jgi:2-dehydro-3-deoxyphosphogluconate aldolase/(4S)-4-hydroxy-2-oxoglutarate aldolase